MAGVPGVRFLPNAITVAAMCSGMSAITFAYHDKMYLAGWAIAVAAILDGLDGPAARLLHSQSRIGAELDSLSDCINFGVVPVIVLYLWELHTPAAGWAACLVYAVCTALRLARFNSLLDDESPKPWAKSFFVGIPSPAGALLVLAPLVLYLRLGHGWWSTPQFTIPWTILIGLAMVSRIPNIPLKAVRIPPKLVLPALLVLTGAIICLFYEPHLTMIVGLGIYLAHLPYAAWKQRHLARHPELWSEPGPRVRRTPRRLTRGAIRRQRVAGFGSDGRRLTPGERRGLGRRRLHR